MSALLYDGQRVLSISARRTLATGAPWARSDHQPGTLGSTPANLKRAILYGMPSRLSRPRRARARDALLASANIKSMAAQEWGKGLKSQPTHVLTSVHYHMPSLATQT